MAIPIKAVLSVSTKGFGVAMKGATKVLGGFVAVAKMATFAILGLTAAFTAIIAKNAIAIDRFGKLSKTTGLSAEFMQRFAFAAEQAGVSADQSSVAMRRFARRLGEAKKGTGELLPELKRLGFSQSEITKMSPEQALFALADVMAKTDDETKQLTTSFKAFDSEGSELVVLLKQGSDAMEELFNEADALGAVLSTTAIQGVEDFNDSFNKLTTLLTGVARQLTAALAPALQTITDEITNFIKQGTKEFGSFESLAEAMAVGIIDAVMTIIQSFSALEKTVIGFVNGFREFAKDLGFVEPTASAKIYQDQLDSILESFNSVRSGIGGGLDGLISRTQTLELGYEALLEAFKRGSTIGTGLSAEEMETFADNMKKVKDRIAEIEAKGRTGIIGDALNDIAVFGMNSALQENIALLEKAFKQQVFNADSISFQYEKYRQILAVLEKAKFNIMAQGNTTEGNNDKVEEQLSLYEKILEALNKIGEEAIIDENVIDRLKERLDPVKRLAKTLEDGLVGAVDRFEDALAQGLINGKADFSDFAKFIKETLAKAFVQRFVTGPILAAFGLAKGGPAKAGTPYIVGEKGPELFVPGASGTVIPNHQLTGSAGMGATSVVYNIQAVDAPSFQSLVARDPEFIYNVSRAGARRTPTGG